MGILMSRLTGCDLVGMQSLAVKAVPSSVVGWHSGIDERGSSGYLGRGVHTTSTKITRQCRQRTPNHAVRRLSTRMQRVERIEKAAE
jgi:hypothetical protein